MSQQIELLVRTDALRRILEEEPEVRIKLESMAIEKIAEELKRKAGKMSLEKYESEMQAVINRAIADANKNLSTKYKFPAEARAVVEEIAREAVTAHFKAEVRRWEASINEFFAAKQAASDAATAAAVLTAIEKMRPTIAIQARQEFISVLETVNQKG